MRAIINVGIVLGILLITTPLLQAGETADHPVSKNTDMSLTVPAKAPQKGSFVKEKTVGLYTVTFKVIKVASGVKGHGGSHNLMVKVEKDGSALMLPYIIGKVIFLEDYTDVKKTLFKSNDWYMNGFDLGLTGKYQLNVLFRPSPHSLKHTANVRYDAEGDK